MLYTKDSVFGGAFVDLCICSSRLCSNSMCSWRLSVSNIFKTSLLSFALKSINAKREEQFFPFNIRPKKISVVLL